MRLQAQRGPMRRVALAFATRFPHLRKIVRGITDYARAHGRWLFTTGGEAFYFPIGALRKWKGDGVITVLRDPAEAAAARRLKIPTVTCVTLVQNAGVPRVGVDHAAIGRLAAEHLITRGFRRFAFYGLQDVTYSAERERAFAGRLAERGFAVERHLSPSAFDIEQYEAWEKETALLRRWLQGLRVPVGVFAANDQRARMVADACELIGRRVPEEVGIIGVDNDEIACEFGDPTLTSIVCDWWAIGFEAAQLLDRLMHGQPPPDHDELIAPTGVVSRESTDVMIVDHPTVARAVAYARDHLGQPFGVEALVAATGASRRHLELAFADSLGCTPAVFLARLRAEKAKELIDQGDYTLTDVARQCGFTDLRHLMRAFERATGMTPQQYQKAAANARRPE